MKNTITPEIILAAEKLADTYNEKSMLECISYTMLDASGDSVNDIAAAVSWQIEIIDYDGHHDLDTLREILSRCGVQISDIEFAYSDTPATTPYEYTGDYDDTLFYSGERYPEEKRVRARLYGYNLPISKA